MDEETRNAGGATSGEDSRALLTDYLAQCRTTVAMFLRLACEDEDPDCADIASRLIKTSLAVVAALEGKADTTHRLIVEHDSPASRAVAASAP